MKKSEIYNRPNLSIFEKILKINLIFLYIIIAIITVSVIGIVFLLSFIILSNSAEMGNLFNIISICIIIMFILLFSYKHFLKKYLYQNKSYKKCLSVNIILIVIHFLIIFNYILIYELIFAVLAIGFSLGTILSWSPNIPVELFFNIFIYLFGFSLIINIIALIQTKRIRKKLIIETVPNQDSETKQIPNLQKDNFKTIENDINSYFSNYH